MSAARFPFRFYGREPADWTPPSPDFLYELQFERPLSDAQRARVEEVFARALREGPAAPGSTGWWWCAGRFAILAVGERYSDAPRLVFDRVAQAMVLAHGVAKLRDVVFSNGWGARGDGWDAWSLARQPEADPGPQRPDALAQRLRRSEDHALGRYEQASSDPPPSAAPPAQGAGSTRAARVRVHFEVIDPYNYPEPQPEDLSAFMPREKKSERWDEAIPNTSPPLARVHVGKRVAGIAHITVDGERVETPFPDDAEPSGPAATDVDGVRAVVASKNAIYDLHLGDQKLKWRMGIHLNNGQVRGLAWTCDNLWAVLADTQLMVDDLSGEHAVYVGAVRCYWGQRLFSARHGTLLVVQFPAMTTIVGVCDWQLKTLASLSGNERFQYDCAGELIFRRDDTWLRAAGVQEEYERWAAPLRRRAERDRQRRFANAKAKRPPAKPHWIHVEEIPTWKHKERYDRLRAALPKGEDWCSISERGDAVTVRSAQGKHWSRGALIDSVSTDGAEVPHDDATRFAEKNGVTNLSLTADGDFLWVIDGTAFNVHRVSMRAREEIDFGNSPFLRNNSLLADIIALGPDDFVALWTDELTWLRRVDARLEVIDRMPVKWARGFAIDHARARLIITTQDRLRLLVVRAVDGKLTLEASFTDGVKEAFFREGTIYATMTDGVHFVLRGLA